MQLASTSDIARLTQSTGCLLGAVNAEVVRISGGRLPCYAIAGKRIPVRWVSIASSCVIPRHEAKGYLALVGVDIDAVEALAGRKHWAPARVQTPRPPLSLPRLKAVL